MGRRTLCCHSGVAPWVHSSGITGKYILSTASSPTSGHSSRLAYTSRFGKADRESTAHAKHSYDPSICLCACALAQ